MRFALALVVLLTGCQVSRFGSLHSGTYMCDVAATTNTCGTTLALMSGPVEVSGAGGDTMSFLAPSENVVFGSRGVSTIQFGAQEDPLAYDITGAGGCYSYAEHDHITTLGTDFFTADVGYSYTGIAACHMPGITADCAIVIAMSCTLRP